jgi:tetrahydromethanopterin S-methyltransferase subunit B
LLSDREETTSKENKTMKTGKFTEGVLLGFAIGTLIMSLIYSIVISRLDDKHYQELERTFEETRKKQ